MNTKEKKYLQILEAIDICMNNVQEELDRINKSISTETEEVNNSIKELKGEL